ncbi:MAG: hypothetical protein L0H59_14685 [Tomitella sp.]|nr:hypothetical protein [Tomitella sp.]
MASTRTASVRVSGIAVASALALTLGLSACSSSDESGQADTSDQASADDASGQASVENGGPADLQALLPGQEAFGKGFTITPIPSEQLSSTFDQARVAGEGQTSDPAQCKEVLDYAAGLDPAQTAMEAALDQERKTTIAVIVTHADTVLDTARAHLDECGSFTVTAGEHTSHVTTSRFAPAGATGDQAIGISRAEAVDGQGTMNTVLAADAADGVAVQVIAQQPSAKALPSDVVDHYQEQTSESAQHVLDEASKN